MDNRNVVFKKRTVFSVGIAAVLWMFAIWVLVLRGPHHAWMGVNLTAVILQVLFVKFFGRIPLSALSYTILLPALILELLFFYETIAHAPFLTLLFLADCCLLIFWEKGSLNAYFTGLSTTAFASSFLLLGYEYLSEKMLPFYFRFSGRMGFTTLPRIGLILGFGLCYLFGFLFFLKLFGRFLKSRKAFRKKICRKLQGLELYVFLLVVFTIFLMVVMESGYFVKSVFSYMSWRMLWFQVFFLFADVVYFCLLIKAVSIKEKMSAARWSKDMALSYNAVLERNMDSLREIRHDTKNLFLSMGGFVERSEDKEMKAFYRENIVPFVEDTLVKNELQDRLRFLEDITLKAFFYYKLAEGTEKKTPVRLEISSPVSVGGNLGELVRILGIFLDNAFEEAALFGGTVHIFIKEEKSLVRFRIGNPVRPEVKRKGIFPGYSEKGEGRGKGLRIVENLLSGNEDLTLNSYFTEQEFIQSLTVKKRASDI